MREQDFLNHFLRKEYFKKHSKVVLALSGGLDSMFLFQLLSTYQNELGIELILAHVNHKQRRESDWEENELRKLADAAELPIYITSFSGDFSEARAREFRYDFFRKIMKEVGATALVTAHHADDQVETILMRLIRGNRLRHLTGIKESQVVDDIEIIRPLLQFHKKDFSPIFHFEDQTNQESTYFRNRIRNRYIPELEKENPRLKSALLDFGMEVSDYQATITELSKQIDVEDLNELFSYSQQTQGILLQNYLNQFPDLNLTKAQFDEVRQILARKSQYRHPLKNGYELIKEYQNFRVCKISPQADEKEDELVLHYQNQVRYMGYLFSFGIPIEGDFVQKVTVSRETSVHIRCRKPGDVITLNGHRKKLRRLFIDLKIPIEKRKTTPIIEQFGEIVSISGIATSDFKKMLEHDIKKILVSHDEITEAAKKLGAQLTKEYEGKNPILIGILKGSIPFMAELVKHIDTHIEMDFMMVSSYHGGTASSGVINIKQDVTQDIKGRHVLFVEDIIDTGQTLKNLRDMFIAREAASVKIATLLDKPEGRVVEIEADYTCFTIPNEFVVGYGLDYKENYRNLPYVGVLKEEVYSN